MVIMHAKALLYLIVILVLYHTIAAVPSAVQFAPNKRIDAIPQHIRKLNVRDERGGVHLCLTNNWAPPCTYHRPSFYPQYPLCWTSLGLDMQLPYKSLGSIGPNTDTACYAFTNINCTRGPDEQHKGYDILRHGGKPSSEFSHRFLSVKCVFDDGKVSDWEATGKDFRQHAPDLKG